MDTSVLLLYIYNSSILTTTATVLLSGVKYNFLLYYATAFRENCGSYRYMPFGALAWEIVRLLLWAVFPIVCFGLYLTIVGLVVLSAQIFCVTCSAFYCQFFVSPEACRQEIRNFVRRLYMQSSIVRVFLRGLRLCWALFWVFVRHGDVIALRELLEFLCRIGSILALHALQPRLIAIGDNLL